jgi:uncharacterized membrane protein
LTFKYFAEMVSTAVEGIAALMIAFGALEAVVGIVLIYAKRGVSHSDLRLVWVHFGIWLMLALEFELAADIVRTGIAPTWTVIGQLAAIGAIRTFLNYFLESDIRDLLPKERAREEESGTTPAGQ